MGMGEWIALNDGLISAVASFLSVRDMARLLSTCRRLRRAEGVDGTIMTVHERRHVARDVTRRRFLGQDGNADAEDNWTRCCHLTKRAAQHHTSPPWSDEERGKLPRKYSESWIRLAHKLKLLQAPLLFGR